jgi:uncharacterized protein with HEPN domain
MMKESKADVVYGQRITQGGRVSVQALRRQLSIIGEYVGRIYLSTKSRPPFIIDKVERAIRK